MRYQCAGNAQLTRYLSLGAFAIELVKAGRECQGVSHDGEIARLEEHTHDFAKDERLRAPYLGLGVGHDLACLGRGDAQHIGQHLLLGIDLGRIVVVVDGTGRVQPVGLGGKCGVGV